MAISKPVYYAIWGAAAGAAMAPVFNKKNPKRLTGAAVGAAAGAGLGAVLSSSGTKKKLTYRCQPGKREGVWVDENETIWTWGVARTKTNKYSLVVNEDRKGGTSDLLGTVSTFDHNPSEEEICEALKSFFND